MVTLQKLKLLVTQFATARNPSRTPAAAAASCFHFRRRKTLKDLLRGSSFRGLIRRRTSGRNPADLAEKKGLISHTLKDLFVSSPPPSDGEGGGGGSGLGLESGGEERRFRLEGFAAGRAPRFGSVGRRYRLWRRGSRPVLFTIPE